MLSTKKSNTKEIDRDALEHAIHDQPRKVESVIIEPIGDHQARYVITWKDRSARDVACAELPGPIPDELDPAEINYGVMPPADRDRDEYVLDAWSFRHELRDPQERADLAKITIHPGNDDTARYVVAVALPSAAVTASSSSSKIACA